MSSLLAGATKQTTTNQNHITFFQPSHHRVIIIGTDLHHILPIPGGWCRRWSPRPFVGFQLFHTLSKFTTQKTCDFNGKSLEHFLFWPVKYVKLETPHNFKLAAARVPARPLWWCMRCSLPLYVLPHLGGANVPLAAKQVSESAQLYVTIRSTANPVLSFLFLTESMQRFSWIWTWFRPRISRFSPAWGSASWRSQMIWGDDESDHEKKNSWNWCGNIGNHRGKDWIEERTEQ